MSSDNLSGMLKNIWLAEMGAAGWPTNNGTTFYAGAFSVSQFKDYSQSPLGKCVSSAGGIVDFGTGLGNLAGVLYSANVDTSTGYWSVPNTGYRLTAGDTIQNTNAVQSVCCSVNSSGISTLPTTYGPNEYPYNDQLKICNLTNTGGFYQFQLSDHVVLLDGSCQFPISTLTGMSSASPWCTNIGGTVWNCGSGNGFMIRTQAAPTGYDPDRLLESLGGVASLMELGITGLTTTYNGAITETGLNINVPGTQGANTQGNNNVSFLLDPNVVIP